MSRNEFETGMMLLTEGLVLPSATWSLARKLQTTMEERGMKAMIEDDVDEESGYFVYRIDGDYAMRVEYSPV